MSPTMTIKADNIDEYIAQFPQRTQKLLKQVRAAIKKTAPDAEETISYGIPTFKLGGKNLVHFAGFEHHIGFYPAPVGIEKFRKELSVYKQGKGSVQFPLEEPMPLDLITRMVRFRVQSSAAKTKNNKK